LQALSDQELRDLRDYGLVNPIARINNGIDVKPKPFLLGCAIHDAYGLPKGRRILLFLSRISPQKGLDLLLRAMAIIRTKLNDWILVVCGYDHDGHLEELYELVNDLELNNYVVFIGPIYGDDKDKVFSVAEAFVLPSRSEGAPMVVLEAMAAGLPVLTTKAAPWEQLTQNDCGWWAEVSVNSIADSLNDLVGTRPDVLKQKGINAQTLVSQQYTWRLAAEQTSELYLWLSGEIPQPDFVDTV
jgi:glycosyltransferase involved in cell wall biosynthesis